MKSTNLVICDSEENYARALAIFFSGKKEFAFQVHVCSSIQSIAMLAAEKEPDILLIDLQHMQELPSQIKAKKVFLLTAGGEKAEGEINALYKYQSGESILADMMKKAPELFEVSGRTTSVERRKKKVIGVFSPVHRAGKTGYALELGEQLAQSENVLYLNLEIYSGSGGFFGEGAQTIGDLVYCSRQEKANLGLLLTTMVCHRGNLDYLLPFPVSEDVKSVCGSEWINLIDRILDQSIYETVILDIDEGIRELYSLLMFCTEIHMPVRKDRYSEAKLRQFEKEVSVLGRDDLLQKVIRKEVTA